MKSGEKQFSAEGIDRKRKIVSVVGGLGISVLVFYLVLLFSASLPPLCLCIAERTPAISDSFAMSMLPVILVLSVMLAVLFGTAVQGPRRQRRRAFSLSK